MSCIGATNEDLDPLTKWHIKLLDRRLPQYRVFAFGNIGRAISDKMSVCLQPSVKTNQLY